MFVYIDRAEASIIARFGFVEDARQATLCLLVCGMWGRDTYKNQSRIPTYQYIALYPLTMLVVFRLFFADCYNNYAMLGQLPFAVLQRKHVRPNHYDVHRIYVTESRASICQSVNPFYDGV